MASTKRTISNGDMFALAQILTAMASKKCADFDTAVKLIELEEEVNKGIENFHKATTKVLDYSDTEKAIDAAVNDINQMRNSGAEHKELLEAYEALNAKFERKDRESYQRKQAEVEKLIASESKHTFSKLDKGKLAGLDLTIGELKIVLKFVN